MQHAFDIFNEVDENQDKNHFIMNTMIKLCLETKYSNKLWSIWSDINQLLGCNKLSYPSLIKCCIESNNFDKGKIIHSKIPLQLIKHDNYIQNSLINFYTHFNQIQVAIKIFESIDEDRRNNSHTISAIMKAYYKNKNYHKALSLFQSYYNEIKMNDICYLFALRSCIKCNDYKFGQYMITGLDINNNQCNIQLLNTIIRFYGYFGQIDKALMIFNHCGNNKTVVTINSMIQGYIDNKDYKNALNLYNDSQYSNFRDDITNMLVLKACIHSNEKNLGQKIISDTLHKTKNTNYLDTAIHFYGHFNLISEAETVFDKIHNKQINSINALMSIYYDNSMFIKSLDLFKRYRNTIQADEVTYMIAIKCYAKVKDIETVMQLFESIDNKTRTIINSMIKMFNDNNMFKHSLSLYNQYKYQHDDVSHLLALKACIGANDKVNGQQIVSNLDEKSNKNHSIELNNTLLIYYGYFGDIDAAWNIFNNIKGKTNVSINNMMQGLIQNNLYSNALELFCKYENDESKLIDDISILQAIKCCTNTDNILKGNDIIQKMINDGNIINHHTELENTLIHFYGHFGDIDNALNIFNEMKNKSIETINCLLTVYSNNEMIEELLKLYEMIKDKYNLEETNVTKLLAIKGYGDLGDISKAIKVFDSINEKSMESVSCMMRAYIVNNRYEDALLFHDKMVQFVN